MTNEPKNLRERLDFALGKIDHASIHDDCDELRIEAYALFRKEYMIGNLVTREELDAAVKKEAERCVSVLDKRSREWSGAFKGGDFTDGMLSATAELREAIMKGPEA